MKLLLASALMIHSQSAFAIDIAACSNPTGKGYYPEIGIVKRQDSGWQDEAIAGGITKAIKHDDGSFDILFVDARKEIISAVADGGTVLMLNRGERQVSFLVVYPGKTAEVFTFLTNNSGKSEYIGVLSRAGDGVLITKAAVMRGDCDYINFDAL